MTNAVQGLQSGCHAWDEIDRSGRFRLSGGVIRELQLNGYDASPIHPKLHWYQRADDGHRQGTG